MDVVLQYFDDCPNWRLAASHLEALTTEIPGLVVSLQQVESPEDAERLSFRGSPSILIDGVDPFAADDAPVAMACRVYSTPNGPAGSPTREQLRAAIMATS